MDTLLLPAAAVGAIERAVELLESGEIVALPTETVYGLAADASNPLAISKVFEAKERPFFDPLIVHLPDGDWLGRLTVVPDEHRDMLARLTAAFWPGPLTVLLPRRPEAVPDLVTAGSLLVAVRRSAHPAFRKVVAAFGRPLAAPSANRFGRISPTTGQHALSELRGRIPLVLDAGPTPHGLESTIVELDAGDTLRVLRHGPVTEEELAGFGRVVSQAASPLEVGRSVPGQTEGHYAPRTPLRLLSAIAPATPPTGQAGGRAGLLAFRTDRLPETGGYARVEVLSERGNLREAAAGFFAALRRLDEAGLDVIFAETVPAESLGQAIMERLRRAAAGSGT